MNKEFLLKCKCGCGAISIVEDADSDEDPEVFISYFPNATYEWNSRNKLIRNLDLIWSIIRGKRYALYEVIIDKKEWDKIKE